MFVLSRGFRFDEQIGEKPNLLNCTETSDNLRETLVKGYFPQFKLLEILCVF